MRIAVAVVVAGLAAVARAHFVLEVPTSVGWDDDLQDQGPCGGFNATDRTNVTDFAVSGSPVALITTHDESSFEYRAAKLSNITHWVSLTQMLMQKGEGDFCEPLIPGIKEWVGQDAVLQLIQRSVMGTLYQVRRSLVLASPPISVSLAPRFSCG